MSRALLPTFNRDTSISGLVDFHLAHNPGATYAVFPDPTTPDGIQRITFLEFGRAVHRFSYLVKSVVQPRTVVGLIATADTLAYVTALAGLAYAGITVFPISPRNSPAAVVSMLREVSAHHVLTTQASLENLIRGIKQELAQGDGYEIEFDELPSLPNMYPNLGHEAPECPFERKSAPERGIYLSDVIYYIHSSGSTGFPKPIPWTWDVVANHHQTPWYSELESQPNDILLGVMPLPSFHTIGVITQLLYPLFSGRPIGLYTPRYPLAPIVASPDATMEALKRTKANAALVVPAFLELWATEPDSVKHLTALRFIITGGGPLATGVGDALTKAGVCISNLYGATEFGLITPIFPNTRKTREEWMWMELSDRATPRWVDHGEGRYELQLIANNRHVLSIENLPDVLGYTTQDLWIQHPSKRGLWRLVGRSDDVITLATGEKVVPGPMEGLIMSSPLVQGALMFGRGRDQVGLLIEMTEGHAIDNGDESALEHFRNEIWPLIEVANSDAPAFVRIFKDLILVASAQKPFSRAPKGSIRRKATFDAYDAEIQALYDSAKNKREADSIPLPASWTPSEILHWIEQLGNSIRDDQPLPLSTDLFEQGFDSLSATFMRNRIVNGLRSSTDARANAAVSKVPNGLVYSNPTISRLAGVINSYFNTNSTESALTHVDAINAMIAQYSKDIPHISPESHNVPKPDGGVVLLTGSTGALGSQILSDCLANDAVRKVYALNRASSKATLEERHEATFTDRGLDVSLLSSPKLVHVEGDASKDLLGLSGDLYQEIRRTVTVIVHNAWRLDFNLSLASFEPNIRGTRHLLDLALTSRHAAYARVLFTSSMGVTLSWPREKGPYPEEPVEDPSYCVGAGYGEGKYVGEQLLLKAAHRGLQTTSLRIGQVSGNRAKGAWATTDWVPILVKSSIVMGCLPEAYGVVSWLPFDVISKSILTLALGPSRPDLALNLVHPRPVSWKALFEVLSSTLAKQGITKTQLPLVPFSEWLEKLGRNAANETEEALRVIPGIKLLSFYSHAGEADLALREANLVNAEAAGLSVLSTTKAQNASLALREVPSLGESDVSAWVSYWQSRGLFA